MRSRLPILIAALAIAITAMIAAGCGSDDSTTSDSGSDTTASSGSFSTITDGTLLIGTDAPYPPFEIGTPADADFGGFDIDVMNAIADQLGLTPEFQDTSFDTIFRDVAAGQFDVVVAASTITPGRQKTVDFSDPYYEAAAGAGRAEGSDIASVDDLAGKIVGAQDATTGETYANDETDAAEVRGFPEGPDAISGRGHRPGRRRDHRPAGRRRRDREAGRDRDRREIPTNELYGIAMSKENPDLLDAVDERAADDLKDDGTLTDLYQKYFTTDPPKSVLEGTTENPS